MTYLILYSYLCISMVVEEIKWNASKNTKILVSFSFVFTLMFLFASLRGNGSGDYFNYLNGVKYIKTFEDLFFIKNYPFELGFRFLSLISNSLNLHPQFVIASMNLLSFTCIYLFLGKDKSLLSLFIFFPIMLQYDMHHSRSAVAMSIGLLFLKSLLKNKIKLSLILFLIAISFHKSSLILAIYPILVFIINKKNLFNIECKVDLKLSTIIIFSALIISVVFPILSIVIQPLNNQITYRLFFKLDSYLKNGRWSYPLRIYDPRIYMNLIIYYYYYFTIPENVDEKKYVFILHKMQLLSILSLIIFRESTFLALRIHNFFNLFLIVFIPKVFSRDLTLTNKKKVKQLKLLIILIYMLYTLSIIIFKQVPYKLYFMKVGR